MKLMWHSRPRCGQHSGNGNEAALQHREQNEREFSLAAAHRGLESFLIVLLTLLGFCICGLLVKAFKHPKKTFVPGTVHEVACGTSQDFWMSKPNEAEWLVGNLSKTVVVTEGPFDCDRLRLACLPDRFPCIYIESIQRHHVDDATRVVGSKLRDSKVKVLCGADGLQRLRIFPGSINTHVNIAGYYCARTVFDYSAQSMCFARQKAVENIKPGSYDCGL